MEFPVKRDATESEINRYLNVKWKKNQGANFWCPIPGCENTPATGKGACQLHMEEFSEQREVGIKDYRLWALWKMGEYTPEADALTIYEYLRSL